MPGTFALSISGNPLTSGSVDILMGILKFRFDKFSPDNQVSITHFARLKYRIEISGTPEDFAYLDNMIKGVQIYTPRYLDKWKIEIKLNYTEKGGEY